MAAAPADFRPAEFVDAKIKKTADGVAPEIQLVENPDILAELVAARTSKRPVIVGFAAETGDANASVIEHARAKLARKGCDLLVVNDVGAGKVFGAEDNEAVLLGADGTVDEVPLRTQDPLGSCGAGRSRPTHGLTETPQSFQSLDSLQTSTQEKHLEPLVHVRVRHRGTPGQDRRPDQRQHPRRVAGRRPQEPRRSGDVRDDRPGAGRRRGHHRGVRRHRPHRPRSGARDRLRLVGQGLRRRDLRRAGHPRRAEPRHRPGRRPRRGGSRRRRH